MSKGHKLWVVALALLGTGQGEHRDSLCVVRGISAHEMLTGDRQGM